MKKNSHHFFKFFLILLILLVPGKVSAYCGDGVLDTGYEACDDGNFINRDGCNSYCQLEDMTPPFLVSSNPGNGATGVATDIPSLSLLFSEELNPKTINLNTVQLKQGGVPLSIEVEMRDDKKTAVVTPRQPLFSEKKHSIYVQGVVDAAGNIQTDPIIVLFDAGVAVDKTAPHVVLTPPAGAYNVSQVVSMQAYLDQRVFKENIDGSAKIYYALNGETPTRSGAVYKDPFTLKTDTTVRYFAEDAAGNRTPTMSARYTFSCPGQANAKTVTPYPECAIQECQFGFLLFGNTCVARLDSKTADPFAGAVTAPLLPSPTPLTINTKPAIRFNEEHQGTLARPILFQDLQRGTVIKFVSGTKIKNSQGKPFIGLITPPQNLYSKDFPIYFGYTFKSIFSFFPSTNEALTFDPAYTIMLPITEVFKSTEPVTVFSYDPTLQKYLPYAADRVAVDFDQGFIRIVADRSGFFFIAQPATGFNLVNFQDTVGHWAQTYAELLYRKGIVKGKDKGIFAPNDFLTRGEFTKIILNAIGAAIPTEAELEASPFPDVPLFAWHTPYIAKAKTLGLIKGYPDNKFKPDLPINRAEAIKIAMTAFGFDLQGADIAEARLRYPDIEKDAWFTPAVAFAVNQDFLQGIRDGRTGVPGKLFGAGRNITRGEMAQLTIKAMELKEAEKK